MKREMEQKEIIRMIESRMEEIESDLEWWTGFYTKAQIKPIKEDARLKINEKTEVYNELSAILKAITEEQN